jgi:hypothetical protein
MQWFASRGLCRRKKRKRHVDLVLETYSTEQAALYLGLSQSVLYRYRNVCGGGPENHIEKGRVRYRKEDLDNWLIGQVG